MSSFIPSMTSADRFIISKIVRQPGRMLTLSMLAAPVLLMTACSQQAGSAPPAGAGMPPPEVSVVTVQPRNIAVGFEYVGQTAGSRETEVRARITGIVEKRTYEEGSRVQAGTVMFQIDPGVYRTQVESTEAAAAVAEAKVSQARREYARLTPLANAKAISQKEYDDARSTLESAEAAFKQTRAQVNEARLNLGYTKVVAPITGMSGVASKSDGNMVTPTDNLLTTLVQTDPIYVNFNVPEADFLKLNADLAKGALSMARKRADNGSLPFEVKVKLADGSVFPTAGKMNFVSAKINPAIGGFEARAQIANPDGALRPGQFVRVLLGGASRATGIAIPQRAVIDGPNGKMVFTVAPDNKLAPRPVELDGWSNGEWIVTKGLQGGDRVLVDGFIKAHNPGMTVTPVPLAVADVAAKPAAKPAATAPAAETNSAASAH